jgi:hypothetical protein
VDTSAEKMTETVSRQRFTASETTHDGEKRIQTVTTEKRRKRVSRQETWRSRIIICLFLLFQNWAGLGAGGQTLSAPWSQRADLRASEECGRRSTLDSLRAGAGRSILFFLTGSDRLVVREDSGSIDLLDPASEQRHQARARPQRWSRVGRAGRGSIFFDSIFFDSISIGSGDCLI